MAEKKKLIKNRRYILPMYLILILVMFILPFYSTEGYSIFKNTTSHLGGQNIPNAWIMNTTFCLLGIACIMEAWLYLSNYCFHKIILTIFGLGLILTALFQHALIVEGMPYYVFEDRLHSVFATVVGLSFTIFAFSVAFIEEKSISRLLAVLAGLIATGLSGLMFMVTDYTGIWQRLIFLITFAWLIFFFEGLKNKRTC